MDFSKVPGWLLAAGIFLIAIGFILSLYAIDEPRTFAGLSFGPTKSKKDEEIIKQIKDQNLKINTELKALKDQFQKEITNVQDRVVNITNVQRKFQKEIANLQNKVGNFRFRLAGRELPSTGGNSKSSLCPSTSYMIGVRMQSDSGGPHGIVSNVIPVCRTLEINSK